MSAGPVLIVDKKVRMKYSIIQQMLFYILLAGVTVVFVYMLADYLAPVLWAMVCATVFYPVFVKLKGVLVNPTVAAVSTILVVVSVVLVPLFVVGSMVVDESLSLYQAISQAEREGYDSASLLDRFARATALLEPYGVSQAEVQGKIQTWAADIAQSVAASLVVFSQLTLTFIINTAIMLYLLFFFIRDGEKLKDLVLHHLPLGDAYERRLVLRFTETTTAVIKGTIAIAVVQGSIGGALFWAVGIANPVLWGVAMGVLAIIPLLGTAIVWFPAAVVLILTGSVWSGVIVLLVGALVISLIDEFLRPRLVGRDSRMPDAVVLLATVGGLATFGVSGFIIGPIIAALFLTLWEMFEERYHMELVNSG